MFVVVQIPLVENTNGECNRDRDGNRDCKQTPPTISARLLQSPHDRAETARSRWHHYTKCLAKSTPAIRERFAPAYLGLFYNSRRTSVFYLFKTPMACFDSLSFQQPPFF